MNSKNPPAGNSALKIPTSLSTLSRPTSKPTPKRFRCLARPIGPKDDPFKQAQLESSPLIALPDDDEDTFQSPRRNLRPAQHGLWESRDRTEVNRNDEELVYLLDKWQAFYTPEKPKQHTGHTEYRIERSDLKATDKGSLFSSSKWRARHSPRSSASLMLGKTSHGPKPPEKSTTETGSPSKRPRRATAELTLKRLRSADKEESEDDSDVHSDPPQAKRARTLFSPREPDREVPHVINVRPGTRPSTTERSPSPSTPRRGIKSISLSMKRTRQESTDHPSALSTNSSPNPATPKRSIELFLSPKKLDWQISHASNIETITPAASADGSSSPAPPRHSIKVFSQKKAPWQISHASNIETITPAASADESSSPAPPRHGIKVFSSPKKTSCQDPHAGNSRPATPASLTRSPSPATPRSILRVKALGSTVTLQSNRKRGVHEAQLSPLHEEVKRVKFAGLPPEPEESH